MDMRVDETRGDESAVQIDDLRPPARPRAYRVGADRGDAVALDPDRVGARVGAGSGPDARVDIGDVERPVGAGEGRSEEHTAELQSLMRTSYAVFCLKKKTRIDQPKQHTCTREPPK